MQQSPQIELDDAAFLEFLVAEGIVDQAAALRARSASAEVGATIEDSLMEFGLVGEDELYRALAIHMNLQFISVDEIDAELVERLTLPLEFLSRTEIIPAYEAENSLVLATSNPRAKDTIASVAFHLDTAITPAIATPAAIKSILRASAPSSAVEPDTTSTSDIERLTAMANDGPVIKMVNDLIAQAADRAASDIHIEAAETDAKVRFRIDGTLVPHSTMPDTVYSAVTSRLKIMARLNISEKRRPQDGRAHLSVRGRSVDIRLSTLPTQYGESIVLRLLDRSRVTLDWRGLGYDGEQVTQIETAVSQPNGVFLVAGPTGSGKTTTLYTALSGINSTERKIVTVEDPIEYSLQGINQVQVDTDIEMSFARALRAILRQDPDVIMVGEIRDEETAEIAIRAALVGRMVLSTIHTNDAISAVVRLRDLGVPSYLLSATLRGVLSQRLVRKICRDCAGNGCKLCNNTGIRGRSVLSEFLEVTPDIASAIARNADIDVLEQIAASTGFSPMKQNAERLVRSGVISQDESMRATG